MSGPFKPCGGACVLQEGHEGDHAIPGYVFPPQLDPPPDDAARAPTDPAPPLPLSVREEAAESIALLAGWVHRVSSGLVSARLMGHDQVGKALAILNAATATLVRLGELAPGDDPHDVFERLAERAMRKAQILSGQGLPNFGKRGRG